eukprot:CAMPEP_0185361196 /NCGR_PEP_ID=MMETSP1364-20130426/10146_1 /TAXON_ID=38817 /ORGANISM="Gephyrocapsa oceanica, Strain RCC1303" /LENGTH=211 /DNA_ID=CAMNT_0027961519 /DNA_START=114 /DNA_END=750 /DNA_ORIENTATION=-
MMEAWAAPFAPLWAVRLAVLGTALAQQHLTALGSHRNPEVRGELRHQPDAVVKHQQPQGHEPDGSLHGALPLRRVLPGAGARRGPTCGAAGPGGGGAAAGGGGTELVGWSASTASVGDGVPAGSPSLRASFGCTAGSVVFGACPILRAKRVRLAAGGGCGSAAASRGAGGHGSGARAALSGFSGLSRSAGAGSVGASTGRPLPTRGRAWPA